MTPQIFLLDLCPCPSGCVYESDTFDRADSTDLGAKWTETAGDWSIDTNRLKISATANAKCTCTTTHPTSSTKYIASVSITLGTDGDIARVFIDDSGKIAELERITSTCGRLRLYDGIFCKGSCNVGLGGFTRLVLCSDGYKVHVGTGGSPMLTVPAVVASSIVALGTGGVCTGDVFFEDFSLSKHNEDDNTCPACGDEGCVWFADFGCSSGSLSAADWTATGTWDYSSGIRCSADGAITVVPENPVASQKFQMSAVLLEAWRTAGTTTTITFSFGGSASVIAELTSTPGTMSGWTVRMMKDGVQYGRAVAYDPFYLDICWDGSVLSAAFVMTQFAAVIDTIATLSPQIAVSGVVAGKSVSVNQLLFWKHPSDLGACPPLCGTPTCTACAPGTFSNTAQVVIADLTGHVYYCTCTDVTIPLAATSSGCQWTGTATGPCSSGTWTATATVTAVTGGYKLTVVVSNAMGPTATFENTVLSGSPVDCLTAFDGDVPLVSASGSTYCTMESATCTFTAPAP